MNEFDSTNELERIYQAAIANKKKLNEAPAAPAPVKPDTPTKPATPTPSPSTTPKPRDPFFPKPGQSPRPKAEAKGKMEEEATGNPALTNFINKRAKFIKK